MKNIRKVICGLVLSAMLVANIPVPKAQAKSSRPATQCKAYYVLNASTGKKITSKNSTKKIYPASTTKLLTALTVLRYVSPNKKIKFTHKMAKSVKSDAAALGLRFNRVYTVKQYLTMLLMVSDADSAVALAWGTAGSTGQFVQLMNREVSSMGLKHTCFDNPVGLDFGSGYKKTYTTAYEFSVIAKKAMENPVICSIVKKHTARISPCGSKNSFIIRNTNAFYSGYKVLVKKANYKVIGSKTGTTSAAGHCLVATAVNAKGEKVIVCFYGSRGVDRMYRDIKHLFDYAFRMI